MTTLTRRNFRKANQKRNYKIVEEFAYVLIEEAVAVVMKRVPSCGTSSIRHFKKIFTYKNDFEIMITGKVYAFYSSTIGLF